uniref:Putative oxidoreductase family protein n=1 Tax=viral metagenome TaxID=1070528 RepID=A0A6H1ZN25_9ZZZZ
MRIFIVGQGSIGRRHYDNLKSLRHELFTADIGDPLRFDVECAFICSPTQFHVEQAIEFIRHGIPVFIEKPLTYCLTELEKIEEVFGKYKTLSMVGCNNRFHPSLLKAKTVANTGKVIFARSEAGYFLPFQRKTDYRKSYSASEYGGVVLDDIHAVDYMYWLFGNIKEMKTVRGKVSDLEIKKEDISEISLLFEKGVSASIHSDYLLKNYHKELSLYLPHEIITYKIQPTNLAYKKEVEYFCNCIEQDIEPMNNIQEAAYVLRKTLESFSDNPSQTFKFTPAKEDTCPNWQQTHNTTLR